MELDLDKLLIEVFSELDSVAKPVALLGDLPDDLDWDLPEDPDWEEGSEDAVDADAFLPDEEEGEEEDDEDVAGLLASVDYYPDDPLVFLNEIYMSDYGYLDGSLLKKVKAAAGKAKSKIHPVKALKSASRKLKKAASAGTKVVKQANRKLATITKASVKSGRKFARKSQRYAKAGLKKAYSNTKKVAKYAQEQVKKANAKAKKYAQAAAKLAKKQAQVVARQVKRTQKYMKEKIEAPFKTMQTVMIVGAVAGGLGLLYVMNR
jgi:pyruvate/2-oxoglutarate dehydrogenase complex dihydrolipoamide acyltransferase (E2) component